MIYRYLFFLLFVTNSFAQVSVHSKRIVAKIENGKSIFLIDTVKYKEKIIENIFSKDLNITFNMIKLIHKESKVCKKSFYYLVLIDQENNIKMARIVFKEGDFFLMKNDNSFNRTYVSCVGKKDKCFPSIICEDNKQFWSCSEEMLQCDANNKECRKFLSIITSDL